MKTRLANSTRNEGTPPRPPLKDLEPWPVHPMPLPDEGLGSWIVRLSHALGLGLATVLYDLWPGQKLKSRRVDLVVPEEVAETLAVRTRSCTAAVLKTTMYDLAANLLADQGWSSGRHPWILPQLGHWTSHGGMQFCPECLAEDAIPYFRRAWRLAFVTVCPRHGNRLLLDACAHCGGSVDPLQAIMPVTDARWERVPMTFCSHCGEDLRTQRNPLENAVPADLLQANAALQARMSSALELGHIEVPGYGSMYSNLYLEGIRCIVKVFTSSSRTNRIKKGINKAFPSSGWDHGVDCTSVIAGFEYLPLAERIRIIGSIGWITEDWPHRFVDVCRNSRATYDAIIHGNPKDAPFWIAAVARNEFTKRLARWRNPSISRDSQPSYRELADRKFSPRLEARERRIEFIRAHQRNTKDLVKLGQMMKKAGLYVRKTNLDSIVRGLPKLISAAKNPDEWWRIAGRPLGEVS